MVLPYNKKSSENKCQEGNVDLSYKQSKKKYSLTTKIDEILFLQKEFEDLIKQFNGEDEPCSSQTSQSSSKPNTNYCKITIDNELNINQLTSPNSSSSDTKLWETLGKKSYLPIHTFKKTVQHCTKN